MNKTFTAIGTMSGTSMDGIDVALLKTNGEYQIEEIADTSLTYPGWLQTLLKAAEFSVRNAQGNVALAASQFNDDLKHYLQQALQIAEQNIASHTQQLASDFLQATALPLSLEHIIQHSTALHAQVISQLLIKANYSATQVDVIGYHGQTLFHNPAAKITVQVGNGQQLANALQIKVVADFRSNDVAHGGQGAPFAPIYHQAIAVRDQLIPCAVINCGGVSNITVITGAAAAAVLGFDMGPGNGLIDRFVKQRTQGKLAMDSDGQFGLQGTVHENILAQLYADQQNFLTQAPPKSLDIADFKLIPALDKLSLEDGCATLEAFTAECIAKAFELIQLARPSWPPLKLLTLAGGGWHNPVITQQLKLRLKNKLACQIITAEKAGALEAQLFAYLAVRSLQHKPLSYPETTGVAAPMTGGVIFTADH